MCEPVNKKGKLVIVSGPSGAGKSTLIEAVLKKVPDLRYSISYTTRPPRGREKNGEDYYFISEDDFNKRMAAGDFAEWAEVHGHLYGTSATYIEGTLAKGEDILLDIDVVGAGKLRAKFPDAISVFVVPPTLAELERRLTGRNTDSSAAVKRRLKNAKAEMAEADRYDHIVVNEDLDKAVSKIEKILEKASANR